MSEPLGSIIEPEFGGKPAVDGNTSGTEKFERRIDEPEIIHGFEVESPVTEKFGGNGDGDSGIRYTKSGKIDGRSLRGRRKQSNGETSEKDAVRLDSISIAGLLMGIHAMGASILKTPELAIEKSEAESLSKAAQDVAAQYNHVINPKIAAWIQLCMICGAVYGPRIVAIRMREKVERDTHKLKLVNHTQPVSEPVNIWPNSEKNFV